MSWDNRCVIPTASGLTLAAQVTPHGPVRQSEREQVKVHSSPAEIGVDWIGAVRRAADLAKLNVPDDLSGPVLRTVLTRPWAKVDGWMPGSIERQLYIGDLAAMLLSRDRLVLMLKSRLADCLELLEDEIKSDDPLASWTRGDLCYRALRSWATSPGSSTR